MLVAGPASFFHNEEKIQVFYKLRLFLGLISTITETVLVVALSRKYGKRFATYTLAMLCLTSGCFFSSTSFLPSTFSMYAVTLSLALFLLEKYASVVSIASIGVLIGWPFSILVFLPITIYLLIKWQFKRVFLSGLITSICVVALSVYADYYHYGKWTQSIFNLLKYNVMSGGESHLYGVEGLTFYFKNGLNNFNFSFILALLFVALLPITWKKYAPYLLVVISPIYVWLAFMSFQPHKEERFSTEESFLVKVSKVLRPIFLGLILSASHNRTFSLLHGYSVPLVVYKHLEHHEYAPSSSTLCVGSEWHSYPSSIFTPSYVKEVRWIDDAFRGLLPLPFNSTLGGTAVAPPYFNNKNRAFDAQYLHDVGTCNLFMELDLKRPHPSHGSDLLKWETLAAVHYLDRKLLPAIYRSFFIPYRWHKKNVFGLYRLLRRVPQSNMEQIIAIGVFGIKESPIASSFTISLVICMLLFNEYCRQRFYPIFKKFSAQAP